VEKMPSAYRQVPSVTTGGSALQMWSCCQGRTTTLQEAALAFNATPAVIRQAVESHYWMFLDGDNILHEGE